VRCAIELGVDIIKTPYCCDPAAWKQLVESCPLPLVAAGGRRWRRSAKPCSSWPMRLPRVARGAVIGRNVWGFKDIPGAVRAFKAVVHDRLTPKEAMKVAGVSESALLTLPGTPGEGRGEGDFEVERLTQFPITLTQTLSRSTGRGLLIIGRTVSSAAIYNHGHPRNRLYRSGRCSIRRALPLCRQQNRSPPGRAALRWPTAVALMTAARLGAACQFAGVLGEDELSLYVLGAMREHGVDTTTAGPLAARASGPFGNRLRRNHPHTDNLLRDEECDRCRRNAASTGVDPLGSRVFIDHYGVPGMIPGRSHRA